jgi:bis(5'-nucleosidyl)-tetraphosphatase
VIRHDESFGIIPLRKAGDHWEVFLIQHRHGRYWGFPKGHAEGNESPEVAAHRELKEETNLDILRFIELEPLMEQYHFTHDGHRVNKRVFYFLAEVEGTIILQKKEISGGLWLPFKEAHERLTHPEGKSILQQVEAILK